MDAGMRLGQLIAHGSRSSVYAWGDDAVVKVPVPSTPDAWIHHEARFTEAVRLVGAPAPRLLGIERVLGRPASIWERIEGPSMWQLVLDRPERAQTEGWRLADIQMALFALVTPVSLPRQHDRLAGKIRRTVSEIDPSLEEAWALLPDPPASTRLCHGDLHPGNVILSSMGPMVIDWFDASRGDPVGDVARTSLLLLADGTDCPPHLPGNDVGPLAALASAYQARIGERLDAPPETLERWRAVEAVARLAEGVSAQTLLDIWDRRGRWPAIQVTGC